MKLQMPLILVLLLSAVLPQLSGQERNNQPSLDTVRQKIDEVKERLALTPDQIEKIRPVLVDELQRFRAVRDKVNAGDQSRRDRLDAARELRQIRSDADNKLKKILSKKQMDELKKVREEWRQQSANANKK